MMKKYLLTIAGFCFATLTYAQEIVTLSYDTPANVQWQGGEKEYYSNIWQTQVVTNVSVPTMQVFRATDPNGTAVIIAPGGGLYALSINSEGNEVAKWLNEKGITAFVLKYRLVPTGDDGVQEISDESTSNPTRIGERIAPIMPLSFADGLTAIAHVRTNAKKYDVNPNKIGFMGFSAGGAVTMGVTFNYDDQNRPDFIVPVYPWMTVMGPYEVPLDAPPMIVICASDDPLQLAPESVTLYSKWLKAQKVAELHMYAKGGHGFGMKNQGLPSDHWISRFYDWALAEGLSIPSVAE